MLNTRMSILGSDHPGGYQSWGMEEKNACRVCFRASKLLGVSPGGLTPISICY